MRRPRYRARIGVRRGKRGDTIWVKVQLPEGGSWEGKTYLPGTSVEIKLGWKASVSWQEAVSRRDEIQRRADAGKPLEDDLPMLFQDYAALWLDSAKGRTDEANVRVHLNPQFGNRLLKAIQGQDIDNWIRTGLKTRAASTIKRQLNTLRAILNDALRTGAIADNPCDRIMKLNGDVPRQRFLEPEEIVRLIASAEQISPWLRDVIVWALHSGMRRGEIQELNWADILTMPTGGKIVMLRQTKSGKPRSVICTRDMIEVLQRQSERRVDGDDRVFPVSKMIWRRRWEAARDLAGLPDINFHDLRRTNATQAAASGVDLRTLASRIGHTDLAMLEKHYAMVVGSAENEAAEKIQDTFDRLTTKIAPIGSDS